jgi:hypothetical protein
VLQSVILGLELIQLFIDSLEGGFQNNLGGDVHIPPGGGTAWSGFRMGFRKR